MKFLFYSDLHLCGIPPRHRVDDFPQALISKLAEVYALADSNGCEFVAFGGDFFNSQRIFNYDVIFDALNIVRDSSLVTYACIGEHDLYGHNPDTYQSSTLAFFVKLCPNMVIMTDPLDIGPAILYAKHEWENVYDAMKVEVDPQRLNILICHELITNERAMFDVIDTETLNLCPYDLVVSGDLHDGYQPHEVNGVWFCNPGSIARRAINEINRWPTVAIIEIEKGNIPIIDLVRLTSARPGSEVFGESIAEIARQPSDFDGDAFTEEMLEFEAESVDIHELIQKVGAKKGIRKEVLEYLDTKRVQNL